MNTTTGTWEWTGRSAGAISSTASRLRWALRCCRSGAGRSSSMRQAARAEQPPDYYPPRLTGMRGSHAGSFEVAHQLRDRRQHRPVGASHTGETYDLVVVGGGLSGLAAAYYFVKNVGRSARVLVLDNHDDFGGHAKRNEFDVDGRTASRSTAARSTSSRRCATTSRRGNCCRASASNLDRFVKTNETQPQPLASLGLRSGHFFDKETWGEDRLVVRPAAAPGSGGRGGYPPEYVARMPLSAKARRRHAAPAGSRISPTTCPA